MSPSIAEIGHSQLKNSIEPNNTRFINICLAWLTELTGQSRINTMVTLRSHQHVTVVLIAGVKIVLNKQMWGPEWPTPMQLVLENSVLSSTELEHCTLNSNKKYAFYSPLGSKIVIFLYEHNNSVDYAPSLAKMLAYYAYSFGAHYARFYAGINGAGQFPTPVNM